MFKFSCSKHNRAIYSISYHLLDYLAIVLLASSINFRMKSLKY